MNLTSSGILTARPPKPTAAPKCYHFFIGRFASPVMPDPDIPGPAGDLEVNGAAEWDNSTLEFSFDTVI
jgi:hypothetical protein